MAADPLDGWRAKSFQNHAKHRVQCEHLSAGFCSCSISSDGAILVSALAIPVVTFNRSTGSSCAVEPRLAVLKVFQGTLMGNDAKWSNNEFRDVCPDEE